MDLIWLKELMERAKKKEIENKMTGDYTIWNILTALRGPDIIFSYDVTNEHQKLKELTTARIRGILGIPEENFYIRRLPLTAIEIAERDCLLEKSVNQTSTKFQNTHFFLHFTMAILALSTLGYDVPNAEKESLTILEEKILSRR